MWAISNVWKCYIQCSADNLRHISSLNGFYCAKQKAFVSSPSDALVQNFALCTRQTEQTEWNYSFTIRKMYDHRCIFKQFWKPIAHLYFAFERFTTKDSGRMHFLRKSRKCFIFFFFIFGPIKGLYLVRRPKRVECLWIFLEEAEASIFTEPLALKRATFKEHLVIFL